jgi:hypothetical protein
VFGGRIQGNTSRNSCHYALMTTSWRPQVMNSIYLRLEQTGSSRSLDNLDTREIHILQVFIPRRITQISNEIFKESDWNICCVLCPAGIPGRVFRAVIWWRRIWLDLGVEVKWSWWSRLTVIQDILTGYRVIWIDRLINLSVSVQCSGYWNVCGKVTTKGCYNSACISQNGNSVAELVAWFTTDL